MFYVNSSSRRPSILFNDNPCWHINEMSERIAEYGCRKTWARACPNAMGYFCSKTLTCSYLYLVMHSPFFKCFNKIWTLGTCVDLSFITPTSVAVIMWCFHQQRHYLQTLQRYNKSVSSRQGSPAESTFVYCLSTMCPICNCWEQFMAYTWSKSFYLNVKISNPLCM